MRLQTDPYLRADQGIGPLTRQLDSLYRQTATQVNLLAEGCIQAVTNAATAAPTAGEHFQGDRITNSAPSELGSPGSKYVVLGWICVASGTPGTWVQMRAPTGN